MSETQWAVQTRPAPEAPWRIVDRGFGGPWKTEARARLWHAKVVESAAEDWTWIAGHEVRLVTRQLPEWEAAS